MNVKVKNNGAFEDLILKGIKGTDGISVPAGGSANQFLQKNSNIDYDFSWSSLNLTNATNTLVTSDKWVKDNSQTGYAYKTVINNEKATATNNIVVGLASEATPSQIESCARAKVRCLQQDIGFIVLYAVTIPTESLPILTVIYN